MPVPSEKPIVLWISLAATGAMALLLLVSGLTFADGDGSLLGLRSLDASPLYLVAGLVGLASIRWRPLRLLWLMLLTLCTLGRAVTLLIVGSPVVIDRASELRGAFSWLVLWVLGSVPTIYAQASDILRGRIQG